MNSQQAKFTQAMQTSKKLLSRTIASAIGIVAATTATAAPLPDGTLLTLTPGSGSGFGVECATGTSCFGMEVVPGMSIWLTDINSYTVRDPDTGEVISVTPTPGKDPGIILGKDQKSGEQELARSSTNTTPGDITGAWNFGGAFGTFYTAPGLIVALGNPLDGTMTLGASANLFDDTGCALATCVGKTELKVWNMAWNGVIFPLGSQYPCTHANCSANLKAGYQVQSYTVTPAPAVEGSLWTMRFYTVVPLGGYEGARFRMALAGVVKRNPLPPLPLPINISGLYGTPINWTPSITGGTPPITCRIGTPPSSGTATVMSNCSSGTYMANIGFIGIDMFTYIPSDINGDGKAGTVSSAVVPPPPPTPTFVTSPTPTPPPPGASPTPTNTPVTTPTPTISTCADQHPIKQATLTGKQGHLTVVVTGHIVSSNANGKEIKICPTTTASYVATTNTPGATVICQVKNNLSRGKGRTQVNDHVKCSDKPIGNDKLHFKIKSGENKKWDGAKWV